MMHRISFSISPERAIGIVRNPTMFHDRVLSGVTPIMSSGFGIRLAARASSAYQRTP